MSRNQPLELYFYTTIILAKRSKYRYLHTLVPPFPPSSTKTRLTQLN